MISDTHCGHLWGLTPPSFWTQYDEDALAFQKEAWTWFINTLNLYKPFDMVIGNGDLIDGRGEKSGGTELIVGDRFKQSSMAVDIINAVQAKDVLIVRGTDYHVGKCEQFEDHIAERTGAQEISDHLRFRMGGYLFDVRHHTGGTTVPWSNSTAIAKELFLANLKENNEVDVMIRSHVHRYVELKINPNQIAFTTPGLQGHSRFGSKRCIGTVNFGVVVIDLDRHKIRVTPVFAELESLKYKIKDY